MPWSTDIGGVRSPLILRMHDYWQAKRAGRAMPARADIDPADLKPVLPNLALVDIKRDPFRVFYRLVGTTIVRFAKFDATGLHRDEFVTANDEDFLAIYAAAIERRVPLFGHDLLHLETGTKRPFEFAVFPLSSDGTSVDKCIDMDDYESLGAIDPHHAIADRRVRMQPAA
jgi:hypothetical protein